MRMPNCMTAIPSFVQTQFLPDREMLNGMKLMAKYTIPTIFATLICRALSEGALANSSATAWIVSQIFDKGEYVCTVLGTFALIRALVEPNSNGWLTKKTSFRILSEEKFQELQTENASLRTEVERLRSLSSY